MGPLVTSQYKAISPVEAGQDKEVALKWQLVQNSCQLSMAGIVEHDKPRGLAEHGDRRA